MDDSPAFATRFGHLVATMNGSRHRQLLGVFMAIVLAHWVEHLVQAFQIFVLGMPRPASLGLVGGIWPWVFTSEWLHYAFAVVMLAGLAALTPGFAGRARQWWILALAIQFWHHIEHLLLLVQALTGWRLPGQSTAVSVLQLFVPRVELHLFYNAVVFVPMVIGAVLHRRSAAASATGCPCAERRIPVPA